MEMENYLGKNVARLLESTPFSHWNVERSVEDDLDERIIHYLFTDNGMELRCDGSENITAIFLQSSEYGGLDDSSNEDLFTLRRDQILDRYGVAQKSGEQIRDPILGDCGAWDRFELKNCVVHFEYKTDSDAINRITLTQRESGTP